MVSLPGCLALISAGENINAEGPGNEVRAWITLWQCVALSGRIVWFCG